MAKKAAQVRAAEVQEDGSAFQVDGCAMIGLVSQDENAAVVQLSDGRRTLIPVGHFLFEKALTLPPPPAVAPTAFDVKMEAERRILARFPDWQQRNMIARGVDLLRKRVEGATWSAQEQAEADALQTAWDWVLAVRVASNELEWNLPADYRNDSHWPMPPAPFPG